MPWGCSFSKPTLRVKLMIIYRLIRFSLENGQKNIIKSKSTSQISRKHVRDMSGVVANRLKIVSELTKE